jgi:DNA-binding NarL/FixJ family response regulator
MLRADEEWKPLRVAAVCANNIAIMNKRICFAGFTGGEVASIMEAAAGNVRVWECAYPPDGPEALAELSAETFDAVVANLHTDGLRGDEILQQAARLQPGALRFIVGDAGDTSLIFKCVQAGNNFIARDSNPDEMLSAVQRGFDLDAQVSSEQFAVAAQATTPQPAPRPAAQPGSKPDVALRILASTTAVVVLLALLLWWNRRPEDSGVLRVKAIATESPASQTVPVLMPGAPTNSAVTTPASLLPLQPPVEGFAQTKVK